jgi:hypothetical protein
VSGFDVDPRDEITECERCGETGLHMQKAWSTRFNREAWLLHDESGDLHECNPFDINDAFDNLEN